MKGLENDGREGFALAIEQQIAVVQSVTTPVELAAKTIFYAAAKTTAA